MKRTCCGLRPQHYGHWSFLLSDFWCSGSSERMSDKESEGEACPCSVAHCETWRTTTRPSSFRSFPLIQDRGSFHSCLSRLQKVPISTLKLWEFCIQKRVIIITRYNETIRFGDCANSWVAGYKLRGWGWALPTPVSSELMQ